MLEWTDQQESASQATEGHLERGVTVIESLVVTKVAGMAAQEIEGVQMGGGRGIGGLVPGGGGGQGRGVSVQVGQVEAAVDLAMTVEYGKPIPQLTESVRRNVINRVEQLVGLRVTEVNITVNDVILPQPSRQQQLPQESIEGPQILPAIQDAKLLGDLQYFWEESARNLPEGLQRTSYWSLRLMQAMDKRDDESRIPGYIFTSYGFVSPRDFGVVLYTTSEKEVQPMDLEPIVLDHHKFRVVVRQVDIQPHGPFVHPLLGKAACWASTRRNHSPHMGVLTAKHAVTESVKRDQGLDSYSPQLGDFVPLADGSQGTLEDLAPDPIDIALVRTFEKAGSSILPTMKLIAPWSDVWLGPKRSKVITVADVRGVFTNPSMPAYVVLADSLQHGDSGTLVQDVSSGAAVGIYLGELTTPAGTVEGYARHAYQVEVIMNAELYL